MKEYIERAAVLKVLEEYYHGADERLHIVKDITSIPTDDVAEVRHARWVDKTDISRAAVEQRVDCSVCGQIFWTMSALLFNYCPNCGALMREDDNGKE